MSNKCESWSVSNKCEYWSVNNKCEYWYWFLNIVPKGFLKIENI